MTNDTRFNHEQLKFAKEATDLGVWIWTIEEDQLKWGDRTIELFGFSPEAGIEEFFQTVHPDDLDRVKTAVDHSVQTGEPYEIRYRIQNDGTVRWIEAHGKLTESENEPVRMIGSVKDVTREMSHQRELEYFRKAMSQNPDELYIVDPDTARIMDVTESVEMRLGYTREELLSMRVHDISPSVGTDINWNQHVKDVKEQGPQTIETFHRRKDGSTFPVEIHVGYAEFEGEARIVATGRDITHREKTEKERTHFRHAVESSGHGVMITDPDGTILYVNPAFEEMTGYDRSELIDQTPRLLKSGEHEEAFYRELWNTITSGEIWRGEIINRRKSGELYHSKQTISPVTDSEGELESFIAVQEDITERKEMESALRKSEKRYRTLFEEANEAFLIESFDDRVLDVNQSACKMLGYSRDELKGLDLEQITPDEIIEKCGGRGIVEYHLAEHGSSLYNSQYLHKDSTMIPVEKSETPIEYEGARAVLVCIRDRTKLERIRKRDQRKSSIVSQVTHDLRTPLNSITGMGEMLTKTDLSAQQQSYLQTIINASRNMERLTNDILDLNRIERGELILDEEPFNIQQLLGEVISLYSEEVSEREVKLSTQVSDDVPERLVGDPDRIKQILSNLVDNAINNTREGSIDVKVDETDRRNGTVTLTFSVSDTGEGIPESKLDDIFEQHMQIDSEMSGSGKGLGLGLSICLNLVDLMDGNMDVESEVGEGTTFTFTIQLQEVNRIEQQEGTPSAALNDVSVLLVEDEVLVRKVFRTHLESHDINVVERETGEAALDELNAENGTTYDVVLLDRRLDDMTGVEVLEKVAEESEAIDTERIYMVSGDAAEKVRQRIDPLPRAGIIEKPVDKPTLINAVSSVVGSQPHEGDQVEIEELQAKIRSISPDPFHILVADDDSNTRTLLNEFLSPVADKLQFVTNGKGAVEARFEKSPHLILMDLQMPEMNGIEAIKSIRLEESERSLPAVSIIVQTASAMKHVESDCLEAGANKFIRKPINKRRLCGSMMDVLMENETA